MNFGLAQILTHTVHSAEPRLRRNWTKSHQLIASKIAGFIHISKILGQRFVRSLGIRSHFDRCHSLAELIFKQVVHDNAVIGASEPAGDMKAVAGL